MTLGRILVVGSVVGAAALAGEWTPSAATAVNGAPEGVSAVFCGRPQGVKAKSVRGSCYEARILVRNWVRDGDPGGGPGDKAYNISLTSDWRVKGAGRRWFRCNAARSTVRRQLFKCVRRGSLYYRITWRVDPD